MALTIPEPDDDAAHLIELQAQVRRLQWHLDDALEQRDEARRERNNTTKAYRRARKQWAEVAADEINQATQAYTERIKDLLAYITFLERDPPCNGHALSTDAPNHIVHADGVGCTTSAGPSTATQ